MCPVCAPAGLIEGPHRVALHVRGEVGVAHRHRRGGVAQQLLDGLERYPTHHQVAGEGVAQRVPPDGPAMPARWPRVAKDGLRAGVLRVADEAAVPLREHPRGVSRRGYSRSASRPLIERYLPLPAALRRARTAPEDVPSSRRGVRWPCPRSPTDRRLARRCAAPC